MEQRRIYVWDLGVRVFHWTLVTLFIVAYFTGESEGDIHSYAGYAVIGLVIFRVLWGFVGTRHARFSNFLASPAAIWAYLRSLWTGHPKHYDGHNPAGGWMVILLLLALAGISWSGLEVYGAEGHGPLAAAPELITTAAADSDNENDDRYEHEHGEDNEAEEFWEEIHELCVNFTLLLIAIHVSGVLISTLLHRENLIGAMITGYKHPPHPIRRSSQSNSAV